MNRVFLSFRKVDDRVARERVDQRLCAEFGREQVFKSGESIPAGTDYVATLKAQAAACPVMVVLIGTRWLAAADEHGARLIDRQNDWVRVEIRTALASGNRVVPVLLGEQTLLPTAAELPADLAAMADLQALRIADSAFDAGIERLVSELKQLLPRLAPEQMPDEPAAASAPEPPAVPTPAQHVTIGGRSSGVVANGPVSGTVAGRDIRGNVVHGDHNETTVKTGGGLGTAAAVLAGAAVGRSADADGGRGLAGKAADWTSAHKATAIISALVVVSGGLGAAIAISSSPTGPRQQAGPLVAATAAALPTTPAPESPSPSPSPTLTTGAEFGTSVDTWTSSIWSDGKVFLAEVPLNAPTYFDGPPSQYQVTSYSISSGQQLNTYVPAALDDNGCIDGVIRNGDGDDLLLTQDIDVVPAQGLTGGGTYLRIQAYDASTGSKAWTALVPAITDDASELCTANLGPLTYDDTASISYTPDGKYALETEVATNTPSSYLVNLETGAVKSEPEGTGLLGDWLSEPVTTTPSTRVKVVNPGTGAIAETFSGNIVNDLVSGVANAGDTPSSGDSGHDVGGDLDFVSFSENLHGEPVGYNLPSGSVAWSASTNSPLIGLSDVAVDPETHAAIAYNTGGYSGNGALAAFDPATGRILWQHTGPVFCGATDGHVYVEANKELVELDEATGAQLNYNEQITSCPEVEDGVIDEAVQTNSAGVGGPFFIHTYVAG